MSGYSRRPSRDFHGRTSRKSLCLSCISLPVLFDFDEEPLGVETSGQDDPPTQPEDGGETQEDPVEDQSPFDGETPGSLPVPQPPTEDGPPAPAADPVPAPPVPQKKGFAYVPHYDVAPQNISSEIDENNIITGSRRHRALVIVGEPTSHNDPKTYGEILGRIDENEWLMAVEVELNNIRRHEVWVVTPKTPGC